MHLNRFDKNKQCNNLRAGLLTSPRSFRTRSFGRSLDENKDIAGNKPGSKAFAECETDAIQDLFFQFAQVDNDGGGIDEEGTPHLCLNGVRELLHSIGERPDDETLTRLFQEADQNNDGKLDLDVSYNKVKP